MKVDEKDFRTYAIAISLIAACAALPYSRMISHGGIVGITLIALTEGNFKQKLNTVKTNPWLICILLFYAVNIVGVFYSSDKQTAYGNLERYFPIVFVPLTLATVGTLLSKRIIHLLLLIFVSAIFVASVICLTSSLIKYQTHEPLQGLGTPEITLTHPEVHNSPWLAFSYTELSSGVNMHPGYLALYVCFAILILLQILKDSSKRATQFFAWFAIAFFTLFLVLLSARIMLLGFAFLTFIIILTFHLKRAHRVRLIILLILGGYLVLANPVTWYRTFQELNGSDYTFHENNHYTNSTEIRIALWSLTLRSLSLNNFLFGNGTGDTRLTIKTTAEHFGTTNILNTNDPHNQFMFTLLGNGLVGLALLAAIVFIPLFVGFHLKDMLLSGFCILFIFICMTESALEVQKGIGFHAIFCSVLLYRVNGFDVIASKWSVLKLKPALRWIR